MFNFNTKRVLNQKRAAATGSFVWAGGRLRVQDRGGRLPVGATPSPQSAAGPDHSPRDGVRIDWICELFPKLRERRDQKGGTLSGGEQQMLALGRALMSAADVVMMDEPSLGLAPMLVKEVFDIIAAINQQGKTVLLVEQNAFAALKIAHYAYVLEVGVIVLQGSGAELIADARVREAYLGG